MFIALDKNKNRISAENANRNEEYFCPLCSAKVILKNGNFKASHFAHKACECSDNWHYDMSEWHMHKQGFFDEKYREVVVTHNGKTHRADILKDGVVIEFQHSPISLKEFMERNEFYIKNGYKIAWVFDVTDAVDCNRLNYSNPNRGIMKWKRPKAVLTSVVPSDYRKDLAIWLSWDNEFPCILEHGGYNSYYGNIIQKVIWSTKDKNGFTDYKRIMLSSHPITMDFNMNCKELFFSKYDWDRFKCTS